MSINIYTRNRPVTEYYPKKIRDWKEFTLEFKDGSSFIIIITLPDFTTKEMPIDRIELVHDFNELCLEFHFGDDSRIVRGDRFTSIQLYAV